MLKILKDISDISIKDSLINTSIPGIELIKSINFNEDELRTLRLNDYFKENSQVKGCSISTNSSGSLSTPASLKKKPRRTLFTEDKLVEIDEQKP